MRWKTSLTVFFPDKIHLPSGHQYHSYHHKSHNHTLFLDKRYDVPKVPATERLREACS